MFCPVLALSCSTRELSEQAQCWWNQDETRHGRKPLRPHNGWSQRQNSRMSLTSSEGSELYYPMLIRRLSSRHHFECPLVSRTVPYHVLAGSSTGKGERAGCSCLSLLHRVCVPKANQRKKQWINQRRRGVESRCDCISKDEEYRMGFQVQRLLNEMKSLGCLEDTELYTTNFYYHS